MSTISAEALESSTRKLFEDLHEHVQSQKKLWQRVPWLALEGYGRQLLVEICPSVWEKGYWPVDIYYNGGTTVALIDLATGELVDVNTDDGILSAENMMMILRQLLRVDATYIINGLMENAKARWGPLADSAGMEKWKKGVRARYKIRKVYVRS